MSESARYVTQSSFYDRMQVGKVLSDRRINALRKKGWYGTGILAVDRHEKIAKKRKVRTRLINLAEFI